MEFVTVLGSSCKKRFRIRMYKLLFSFLAYEIYKHKMYCRLDNTEEKEQLMFYAVKYSVLIYLNVLKFTQKTCVGISLNSYNNSYNLHCVQKSLYGE